LALDYEWDATVDPATHPYLRSAADMAALGFVGDPYLRHP
jgi:hypothetical protein